MTSGCCGVPSQSFEGASEYLIVSFEGVLQGTL